MHLAAGGSAQEQADEGQCDRSQLLFHEDLLSLRVYIAWASAALEGARPGPDVRVSRPRQRPSRIAGRSYTVDPDGAPSTPGVS